MPELVWNRFFAACGAFFFATERPKSMMNRLTCRLVARADRSATLEGDARRFARAPRTALPVPARRPSRARDRASSGATMTLGKMTVAQLREALAGKGLDTSGLKAALVARLEEANAGSGNPTGASACA